MYAADVLPELITGACAILTALVGYMVEQRFGRRLEALEEYAAETRARLEALEDEWHA